MKNDLISMVWEYLPEHKRQALKGWAEGVITSRELKEIMGLMAYILIISVMFGNVTHISSHPFPTLTECHAQGGIASTNALKLVGTENGPTGFKYQCVPNRIKRP